MIALKTSPSSSAVLSNASCCSEVVGVGPEGFTGFIPTPDLNSLEVEDFYQSIYSKMICH